MTPASVGPLSRPLPLHRVTPAGVQMTVLADDAERVALAVDLDLPAIHRLEGRFRVTGGTDRVRVVGVLEASVDQTCVVTLDVFTSDLTEDVEVEFAHPPDARDRAVDIDLGGDPPDELTGDHIDLGAIAAEFLALSLDPYPKKPGATFEGGPDEAVGSPFDKLAELRPRGPEGGS